MEISKESILEAYETRGEDYTWDIYQPIPLKGYEETYKYAGRKCTDRLEYLKNFIDSHYNNKKIKILDIGCNNGYFVFELSRMGHTASGVDTNQHFIDKCNFLLKESCPDYNPTFEVMNINEDNVDEMGLEKYDLILCFSVAHHLKNKFKFLNRISRICKNVIFEVDGDIKYENELKTFFYDVEKIGTANDPYGTLGRLKRYLYFCSNDNVDIVKKYNMIWGRNVFLKDDVIIKRQTVNPNHTWLYSDLLYEFETLIEYENSGFFPKLFKYIRGDITHEIHMEYIENTGKPSLSEIERFYDFLSSNGLMILDFLADMFLFDKDNKIKIIDVESVVKESEQPLFLKNKDRVFKYNTYSKQINFLKTHFNL